MMDDPEYVLICLYIPTIYMPTTAVTCLNILMYYWYKNDAFLYVIRHVALLYDKRSTLSKSTKQRDRHAGD